MRVKASYTIENSYIVTLFVIVSVLLIYLCFFIHDSVILKNSALKLAVRAEAVDNDRQVEELKQSGINYITQKTILTKNVLVNIKNNKNNISVECTGNFISSSRLFSQYKNISKHAEVYKSNPDDFIRFTNALKDAIE